MAHEIPDNLKSIGRELLEQLDNTSYKPTAMLWTDSLRNGQWTLVIGTMSARVPEGTSPEEMNKKHDAIAADVEKLLRRVAGKDANIEFAIMAPSNRFLQTFAMIIVTGEDDLSEIEVHDSLVNNIPTGSNLIYRLTLK